MRLPGLIDIHVHMREPGGEFKETWSIGTAAALAGGFTTVLAMPNTMPPVIDDASLGAALAAAAKGARCDYAHYVGASVTNVEDVGGLAPRTAGLKMYLGRTFGDLQLDDWAVCSAHLEQWPEDHVVSVHAEGAALQKVVELAEAIGRSIHVTHVAGAEEIRIVTAAKERGASITCEVTPHHLLMDQTTSLPPGRAEVRPRLGSPLDRQALWDRLDAIDCIATDHAPHTLAEKDGENPPPGFPGLESALPLLLTAVHDGLLSIDDLIERLSRRPAQIFGLPMDGETSVEVDVDENYEIGPGHSLCGWTPFAGRPVRGRVTEVVIRGRTAFRHGEIVAAPGTGGDVRSGRT